MQLNSKNSIPIPTIHLINSTAAASRLHHRLQLSRVFHFSLKTVSCLGSVRLLKDVCQERVLQFPGFDHFQWSFHGLSATLMSLSFFNGDEFRSDSREDGKPLSKASRNDIYGTRKWTNILLVANVLVYVAQTVSEGKLLFWGAKINSLISAGQLWRLATSSFLHANIGHLMVNCYSLNSVGPTVENICGPKRYLAIYITSAIASSSTSYWFCKAPAVGASGAIFGLVGSFALFILRHRGIIEGTGRDLQQIAQVIVLNMGIGFLSRGIDNWGHVGGLIGGAAASWFLGPAWEIKSITRNGRKVLTDKAPIFSLFKSR